MPRKIRKEIDKYPEDKTNAFYPCKSHEDLDDFYHTYVRKNGTNEWVNLQYIQRKKELDMISWLQSIKK